MKLQWVSPVLLASALGWRLWDWGLLLQDLSWGYLEMEAGCWEVDLHPVMELEW